MPHKANEEQYLPFKGWPRTVGGAPNGRAPNGHAAAILLVYAAGVGPAARLMYRQDSGELAKTVFEKGYAPVIWLQNRTFLSAPIYRYVDMWGAMDDYWPPNNTSDGIRQPADGSPKPSR